MRRAYRIFALMISLVLMTTGASSQTGQDSTMIVEEGFLDTESLLEHIEVEEDDPDLMEKILALQEHPLDLNTASRRDFARIPGLAPAEIRDILQLRNSLKRFQSIYQLTLLDDGDIVLEKVRPYVFAVPETILPALPTIRITSRTIKDLKTRRGYSNGSFMGSGVKAYNRLTIEHDRKLAAGLLTEKDAGERIGDGFLSGYVGIRDVWVFSRVIAGDYTVESGQGLVLWRASAFGKGSEAIAVSRKSESGIQPYRSSDEFNFFRGVAATAEVTAGEDRFVASSWYSRRSLDASSSDTGVTSFYTAGLFRTESELRRKGTVNGTVTGGRLRFLSKEFSVGATLVSTRLDKPVFSERLYRFAGSHSTAASVDAELSMGWLDPGKAQITFSGELARSSDALAGIIGAVFNVARGASVAVVYRNYSPRFISLYANAFGERGETQNERGLYLACDLRPARWLRITGYIDHFHFPWRTFENALPSAGREILIQSDANVGRNLELSMRFTGKAMETTFAGVDQLQRGIRVQGERKHQRVRLSATYQASPQIRLRGRIERVDVSYQFPRPSERGWLLFQDVRYAASRITVDGRIVFFHTDSYDSRIYEYENDIRGVFSNPAVFGKGRRWYLLIRWRALDMITLSMKYAETQKENVTAISSGLTEITGNIDNRISIQLEIKL